MASYVYGNTARKELQQVAPRQAKPQREVSQRVKKNQDKALHMSRGYVVFLAVAAIVTLFSCVQYLKLQSEITSRSKHITAMQQELAEAKEENTTRYNAIVNSMNLEGIRDKAMNELGMVYATEDQVISYTSPNSNTVTQYASIPRSGIVAGEDVIE
ncbi:MAG: hypothetical protein UHS49_01810 [Faecalimonas sp.]|nr:hypothetical protein [Faecalimonas sp.]